MGLWPLYLIGLLVSANGDISTGKKGTEFVKSSASALRVFVTDMPIIFEMPSLSPTMEKGNLVSWCKNEGDTLAVGDLIAEIDTDKATMEVESIYKGVLWKILVPAGTHDVAVRTPIAVIKQKNDTDDDLQRALESASAGEQNNTAEVANEPEPSVEIENDVQEPALESSHSAVKASPLAKRLANEYGIDLSSIVGTGPHGRIVKSDVLSVKQMSRPVQNIPTGARYVDEAISSIRKVMAEKLTKTKQEVPHFYMTVSADVSDLLRIRKQLNDSGKLDTKITVNDLIVKAVALAMKDEPSVNVMWAAGKVRRFSTVDVSVAVAVDDGLITPIIWSADLKPLVMISKEIKDLAKKAKEGRLKPDQFIGGGITVSNLGMYNVDSFLSIINAPQGSILSIGPAKKEAVFDDAGHVKAIDVLQIGYAADHRVIDGGKAAKFLETLKKYLENPVLLFI